jgi:hypothetical protein
MSAEVYMACEHCKSAFHVGYIVTMQSNFVFDRDMASRLQPLQEWITKHTYCGDELRIPKLLWEPNVDEEYGGWVIESSRNRPI